MINNSEPIDTHGESYRTLLATLNAETEEARASAENYRKLRRQAALEEDADDYATYALAAEKAEVTYHKKKLYLDWYNRERFQKESLETFEARAPWLDDFVPELCD